MERDKDMTCKAFASASAVVPESRSPVGRTGERGPRLVAGFGFAALAFLAGGCGGGKFVALNSSTGFQRQVLQAEKPVMVQFHKGGCLWCAMLGPTLDRLADDYQGRVVFAEYELMNWLGGVTNWELRTKYDIHWYPTVVLFVNGREKQRWVAQYDVGSYRRALDEVLRTRTRQTATAMPAPAPAKR
jgi:thioredoxin 1